MSSSSPPPARPSWFAAWMIETVSQVEEKWGPYEDRRELTHTGSGNVREQLQERNLALAERTGLSPAARHGLAVARWGGLALLLLAMISGAGAAQAVLGSGAAPVNLFWALTGLLGLHLLTLLLWVFTLPLGNRLHSVPATLLLRLSTWANRHAAIALPSSQTEAKPTSPADDSAAQARSLLAPALLSMLRRAGMLRPLTGFSSHLWWSLALFSSLVTLAILLATRRYGFVWETTLLDPQLFKGLTVTLGALPAWLGFTLPEPELVARTVAGTTLSAGEQAVWSRWLLGCVVVYGLLPRLLLLLLCGAWSWRNRLRLAPDWQARGLAIQEARLAGRASPAAVVDQAPATLPRGQSHTVETLQPAPPGWQAERQIVGLELGVDTPWPPKELDSAVPALGELHDSGHYDSLPAIKQLLASYSQHAPQELVIVLDARRTPDRGMAWTLERLQQLVPHARLHFLNRTATGHRMEQWLQFLKDQAIQLRLEPQSSASVAPPSP